ncbi:hypothetical protein QR98_0086980 [Sarcoptes scabiei]|uniref:Uncharacterized protein n=1 Tax=Sarcoptes scabiei TaxID=52283 RepID=A0A132AGN0_SARSC|nr:hypothetical protein QR98_0086980 [Sarcoptes scabiei]
MLMQQMCCEIQYFDEKKTLLRTIFKETLVQCNEAIRKHMIDKDKLKEITLSVNDERYVRNLLENPLTIVLMGNRPCMKARIVNYILGFELLPVSSEI